MSKIYVSSFNDNGITRWGLFYENSKGIQHLTEDFKKLSFESEDAAKAKLKSMESERQSEDGAFPFSLEEARTFAENHDWKFASK